MGSTSEEVNREVPFKGLNWFFDHCETVTDQNLERIKALGGGIAIQHRMPVSRWVAGGRPVRASALGSSLWRTWPELSVPWPRQPGGPAP